MTPARLVFTVNALADIEAFAAYIFDRHQAAGARFPTAVRQTAESICEYPEAAKRIDFEAVSPLNLRQTTVRGFRNDVLIFRDEPPIVPIEHVFHGARDWVSFL